MKTTLFLSLLLLLSTTALARIDEGDFSFEGKVDEKGNFRLKIVKTFPSRVLLKDIFNKLYLNEKTQKLIDPNVESISLSKNRKSLLNSNRFTSYYSTTKATKSGVTAKIVNKCNIVANDIQILNQCKITSARAPVVGDLFHYGNSEITCRELSNKKKRCVVKINGRPDSVNILFMMKRSSERLAVSGMSNTLRSMYKGYYYLIKAESMIAATQQLHFRENIASFWKELIHYFEDEQDLEGTIIFNSTNYGLKAYKL